MAGVRKRHTVEFKAKVALEAIRQQKTSNQLTAEYGIHATQINTWKKQALAAIPEAFSGKREWAQETQQGQIDESTPFYSCPAPPRCVAALSRWLRSSGWLPTNQIARNHVARDDRDPAKMVLALTDNWYWHCAQVNSALFVVQHCVPPQRGQINPLGQRN